MEEKPNGNYIRMLRAIWNKYWRQQPTKQQPYGHLHPITKTIKVRRSRHVGHCWEFRDELKSDVLLWTHSHGRAKAGRPARTYIQQLSEDTWYSLEDMPKGMNNREEGRERVRDISPGCTRRCWYIYIYICVCVCVCVCLCVFSENVTNILVWWFCLKANHFLLFNT